MGRIRPNTQFNVSGNYKIIVHNYSNSSFFVDESAIDRVCVAMDEYIDPKKHLLSELLMPTSPNVAVVASSSVSSAGPSLVSAFGVAVSASDTYPAVLTHLR